MVDRPVESLRDRAATHRRRCRAARVVDTEALPGAGSAPGVTMPSAGIALDGDHLAALRAHDPPVIGRSRDGRTFLDLRSVDPADDDGRPIAASGFALRRRRRTHQRNVAAGGDEGRCDGRARRSRQVVARPGAHRHRPRPVRGGEATWPHDRSRLRPHRRCPSGAGVSFVDVPGHVRFLRNMLAGVGGVDACLFVVAATEGWKPQSEEHLRILELLGLRHGVIAMTKRDLVDDEWAEIAAARDRRPRGRHVPRRRTDRARRLADRQRPRRPASGARRVGARDTRRRPTADRPRLWIDRVFAAEGLRHRRHRHVDRRTAGP